MADIAKRLYESAQKRDPDQPEVLNNKRRDYYKIFMLIHFFLFDNLVP